MLTTCLTKGLTTYLKNCHIIPSYKLNYNIGIDGGDDITNVLIEKDYIIPCNKEIIFSIPDIEEEYNIKILMGPNILSCDNILLDNIIIKNNINTEKKLFIELNIHISYINIIIKTKGRNIYNNIIKYTDINSSTILYNITNNIIDVPYYKLTFELDNLIKTIRKKIKMNHIKLDEEEIEMLEDKFNNLLIKLNDKLLTYQKLLDIKNNLKISFFID
jgi:hypothetical protein